jgi:hypothetical protein
MATRDLLISPGEAAALLRSPTASPAWGWQPGRHWRIGLEGGACLHLRNHAGRWLLHRDEHDPRIRPLHHLTAEVLPLAAKQVWYTLSRGGDR